MDALAEKYKRKLHSRDERLASIQGVVEAMLAEECGACRGGCEACLLHRLAGLVLTDHGKLMARDLGEDGDGDR